MAGTSDDGYKPTEQYRRRLRSRNIAVAVVLAVLCLIFYVSTWVKFGIGVRM